MASNIVFSAIGGGDINQTQHSFTLYGTDDKAFAGVTPLFFGAGVSARLVFDQIEFLAPGSNQITRFPGSTGREDKQMKGTGNSFTIHGRVIDPDANEADIIKGVKGFSKINKLQGEFSVVFGGVDIGSAANAVLDDIQFKPWGEGTGAEWPFALTFTNISGVET